jgi:hypothetical protein
VDSPHSLRCKPKFRLHRILHTLLYQVLTIQQPSQFSVLNLNGVARIRRHQFVGINRQYTGEQHGLAAVVGSELAWDGGFEAARFSVGLRVGQGKPGAVRGTTLPG